jgi:ABC-type transporter Mla subunit MlaD
MAPPVRLDAALKRLSSALDQLEAASDRLGRTGAEKRDLADTLAIMEDDRGRLASELDAALTRTQALEHATEEVALRLGRAGGTLRRLLSEADAAEPEKVDD